MRRPIFVIVHRPISPHLPIDCASMPAKLPRYLCHLDILPSHRCNLISFLRAQLLVFHSTSLSHLLLESKRPNRPMDQTAVPSGLLARLLLIRFAGRIQAKSERWHLTADVREKYEAPPRLPKPRAQYQFLLGRSRGSPIIFAQWGVHSQDGDRHRQEGIRDGRGSRYVD